MSDQRQYINGQKSPAGTTRMMRPGQMMGRGGPMAMMKGEKAKNFKGTMLRLLSALAPYKMRLSIVFLFAIASTVFSIIGPKIMGQATTVLLEGILAQFSGKGAIDFTKIATILLTVLAPLYCCRPWLLLLWVGLWLGFPQIFPTGSESRSRPKLTGSPSGILIVPHMERPCRGLPMMWIPLTTP